MQTDRQYTCFDQNTQIHGKMQAVHYRHNSRQSVKYAEKLFSAHGCFGCIALPVWKHMLEARSLLFKLLARCQLQLDPCMKERQRESESV